MKVKVSVSLSEKLVEQVDRAAKLIPKATRSSVIEAWIRRSARVHAALRLQADTIAYYESLGSERDAEHLAHAASRAARKLNFDAG